MEALREGRAKAVPVDEAFKGILERAGESICEEGDTRAEWVAEAERRIEAMRRGEMETIPGEEVMREIRDRKRI